MASTYKIGTGSLCQVGIQTASGTPATDWSTNKNGTTGVRTVTPDTLINMTSESFKVAIEKGDEGNLFASKTANQRDLTAISVEGSVSSILRPEFVDWVFKATMGATDTSGNYILLEPNNDLPVSTFVIDRGGITKCYNNVTVKSAKISATAHDYVKCDFDLIGVREIAENTTDPDIEWKGLNTAVKNYNKPSYRCTDAVLYYGAKGTGSSSLTQTLNVENCDITIDNAVETTPACYDSGFYNERPVMGRRAVTVDFTIPYQDGVDQFKQDYYQGEESPSLAMKLVFTTNDTAEKVEIYMPVINITSGDANVNGTGIIEASFSGEVLTVGTYEPITVTVTHNP